MYDNIKRNKNILNEVGLVRDDWVIELLPSEDAKGVLMRSELALGRMVCYFKSEYKSKFAKQ